MNALKDLKLDDVLDDLRSQASTRIDELISQGRKQARTASGGHDDTALFSAFSVGILAGVVVGAAIALLLTPFSGKHARAKLSEHVDKIRSDNMPSWDSGTRNGNGTAAGSYEPAFSSPKPIV